MADETVDSWEDLEDNGELDKQLQNLVPSQSSTSNNSSSSNKESSKQSDGVVSPVATLQEDSDGRTAYKPSVRILKREPNASGHNNPSPSVRPQQNKPIRTLEEREAAYAEARLRILGSAESSQDSELNNGETNPSSSSGTLAAAAAAAGTASSEPSSMAQSGNSAKDSCQNNR